MDAGEENAERREKQERPDGGKIMTDFSADTHKEHETTSRRHIFSVAPHFPDMPCASSPRKFHSDRANVFLRPCSHRGVVLLYKEETAVPPGIFDSLHPSKCEAQKMVSLPETFAAKSCGNTTFPSPPEKRSFLERRN